MFQGTGGHLKAVVVAAIIIQAAISITLSLPASGTGRVCEVSSAPPAESPCNATARIDGMIRQVSEGLVGKYIQALQDFKTRYSYRGDRCYPASDYIASVFRSNGLNVSFNEFTYQYYRMRNVIGEKRGTLNPDTVFIICSHYDSTSNYWAWTEAPGADDNGSGTAAVMALAEIMSDYDFNCTVRFVCFSGEEQGLKGSGRYASDIVTAGENVSAVINMDMIASNPDPGLSTVRLFTGVLTIKDPTGLVNEIINTTAIHADPIRLEIVNAGGAGNSDHQSFAANYRSVLLIESQFSPYYHSTSDTIDKLNLTYCANVTQLTGATIARMAGINPGDTAPPAFSRLGPANGTYAVAIPEISVEVTDPGGVNATALAMKVNGANVSFSASQIPMGYNLTYIPSAPYADGQAIEVLVEAADTSGNRGNRTWGFTADAASPEPPGNLSIRKGSVELIKRGLAIDVGGTYDSRYAERPSVIFHDGEYKMWYSGHDGSTFRICYANSSDGLTWTKHGVVLDKGAIGDWDGVHAAYPSVIYDGEYKMWYSGFCSPSWRILYANSSDGLVWNKQGLAINVSAPGGLDSSFAYYQSVLKTTEYKMWYTGLDGLSMKILYANSSDGLVWNKHTVPVTPDGPGIVHGDANTMAPAVAFDGEKYHMYFERYDGLRVRTMHALSANGLDWTELGLALDVNSSSAQDPYRANRCCALIEGNETKVWYTGYNNNYQVIMYANLTPAVAPKDILLSWTPSGSEDVVAYDVFRESRPSAFTAMSGANPEFYKAPAGLTPWSYRTEYRHNISVYGPLSPTDPAYFMMPDDNILNVSLYIRDGFGNWTKLANETDYQCDLATGFTEITSIEFGYNNEIFACYNQSATKALRVYGSHMADVRAADSEADYYYVVRARDRAGNLAYCPETAGKLGTALDAGWNLVGDPYMAGPRHITEELGWLGWDAARTWDPEKQPNHWTVNRPGRDEAINSLQNVTALAGIWLQIEEQDIFAVCGMVANSTIPLRAGWNLVSYPYHEMMQASDALYGIPWDGAAVYDIYSPALLSQLQASEPLFPGQALWVHVTSDTVWTAVNRP